MRPYRRERIATAVRNIVSEAIVHKLHDPRIEALSSVTHVDVTGDLQLAKVYLSVPGGDAVERRMMAAMVGAAGYIKRMIAEELQLRQCPELRFFVDEGAKTARRTLELIEENRQASPEVVESDECVEAESTTESSDPPAGGAAPSAAGARDAPSAWEDAPE